MLTNTVFTSPFKSNNSQLSYCSCNYNWHHYHHGLYNHYGIQKPVQLANAKAKRHCEFIAGRYCATQAMEKLCRSAKKPDKSQLLIQQDRSPLWPKGIIGSISHSSDRAMAVVGKVDSYAGLGIDCESLLTDSAAREIIDLVLQPLEIELLLSQHLELKLEFGPLVTLAFSAKESLFKALSPSVANIESFLDFTIHSIRSDKLILTPHKRLNDNWPTATEFSIDYIKQPKNIVTLAAITATKR